VSKLNLWSPAYNLTEAGFS